MDPILYSVILNKNFHFYDSHTVQCYIPKPQNHSHSHSILEWMTGEEGKKIHQVRDTVDYGKYPYPS